VEAEKVSFAAALIAGLLSFFSPCVLPLVPAYLGYLTGVMANEMRSAKRLPIWVHALFFVLGFGLVFVLLGATAGLLGSILYPIMPYVIRIGGILLIIFGLQTMGVISIPWLAMDRRFELEHGQNRSFGRSFLIGIVFAAGWTPCVGPVLTAITILAADSQTVATGAALLAVYALGLGAPFLAVAGMVDVALPLVHKMNRYLRGISIVSGILLIIMGILLTLGLFEQLVFWLNATLMAPAGP
jgi:cytochrome c-type biogenesis protein